MVADTYSSDGIGVLLMGVGNDNNSWGGNANTSVFQIFADALTNTLSNAVTGGTLDLSGSPPPTTSSQVRYAGLIFTGVLLSNQLIQVPNLNKWWLVKNATSGSFTLKFKTSGGSASTAIPQNSGWQLVRCDGSNVIEVWPFNTAQIQMPDGTVGAPAYSNLTEPTSGWYRAGTQDWRLSINGVAVLQCTGTGASSASVINVLSPNALQVAGVGVISNGSIVKAADGAVGAPGITFNSETTSGLYRIGASDIGFAIAGAKVGEWTAAGYAVTGTLSSTGNFAVATNKFTVDASNGNTVAAGTIGGTSITASAALSGATAAGAMLASQAEQEAASATNKLVAPGTQHYHPGMAKAWVAHDSAGNISASYNVSGVVRNATGKFTITLATAMSSTAYPVLATGVRAGGSNDMMASLTGAPATTSFQIFYCDASAVATNPTAGFVVVYGDLP